MYVKSSVNPAFVKYRKTQNNVGKVTFVAGGFSGVFLQGNEPFDNLSRHLSNYPLLF